MKFKNLLIGSLLTATTAVLPVWAGDLLPEMQSLREQFEKASIPSSANRMRELLNMVTVD